MQYFRPNSIEEAVSVLSAYGEKGAVIAGGTFFVPHRAELFTDVEAVIDIERAKLDYVTFDGERLKIGAATKLVSILTSDVILNGPLKVIAETAGEITPPEVRNMASVGGNLCLSAEADLPTALIALSAEIVMISATGSRVLPLEEFYLGYLQNALKANEIVTEVQIPYPPLRTGGAFLKFKRVSVDMPLLNAAARITLGVKGECINVRVVLGAATNIPIRVKSAEELLVGSHCDKAIIARAADCAGDVEYISDFRASAELRKIWGKAAVKRVLQTAIERSQEKEVSKHA